MRVIPDSLRPSRLPWKRILPPALLFLILFSRFLSAGIAYYPQLDDYIQYINYPSTPNRWALIVEQGLLSSRPLAGLSDLYVWSAFSDCFLLAVASLCLLFTAAACLLEAVLRARFGCGRLFIPLFTLSPLAIEGTYWLSASTRIVPGLFFTALSGFLLHRYLETGNKRLLPAYALTLLFSFGFYEPILALSVTYSAILAIHARAIGQRGAIALILTIPTAALYFTFTALAPSASSAPLASRIEWVLPLTPYYFNTFLPDLLDQFKTVFREGGILLPLRAAVRAIEGLNLPRLLLLLALTAAQILISKCHIYKEETKSTHQALTVGILLFLAPLAPFFLIANPWFSFRCALPALPGAAFLLDRLLCPRVKRKQMQSIAITALVFLFTLGSFSEIRDYRATTENDRAVTDAILKTFAQTPPTGDVAILGLNPSHLPTQSLLYHEHITGVTESTWALRGMLESRGFDSPHEIVPLPTDRKIIYEPWNHSEKSLARFSTFYRYEQATASLIPLTCQRIGEAEWCLTNPDGSLFAQVREEALIGSLILFPS